LRSKAEAISRQDSPLTHGRGFASLVITRPSSLCQCETPPYFWTGKWQEGEREADEDMKAGRVKSFDSVDELIKELDWK